MNQLFTALLAWVVFKENAGRRIVVDMLAIVAGGVVLAWPQEAVSAQDWTGPLAVAFACFSTEPFSGAGLSILLLRESISLMFLLAAVLMAVGVWIHLMENHVHEHQHELLEHDHRHTHDEHHQHMHLFGWDGTEPHAYADAAQSCVFSGCASSAWALKCLGRDWFSRSELKLARNQLGCCIL